MTYTLVATAKNEGPYLLEWVAYHRMIGFDHILLFQNDSDDGTHETMRCLDRLGMAEYRYNRASQGRHQVKAYKRAARQPCYQNSEWAIALDLDEFLQIHAGDGHLNDLVAALPEADEVLLNWRRFGHSGQLRLDDALVTERFTRAEPDARVTEKLTPYKALFRPALFERPGIHRPPGAKKPEGEIRTTNGSGLGQGGFTRHRFRATDPGKRALAQVNHYIVRDAASFVLKSYRGSAHQSHRDVSRKYWARRNFNQDADLALAGRAADIRAQMADMDAASGGELMDLRRRSIEMHQERFEILMDDPDYRALYEFCVA